jgi:diacylglycerol kinase (ATP)
MFRRVTTRLGYAFRGLWHAARMDVAFLEHLICTVAVVVAAVVLRVNLVEASLLTLCVFAVVTAEMFNTALEQFVRAVHPEKNPEIGKALDIAAGAVLVASCGAAIVGGIIFAYRLGILFSWWK